MKYKNQVKPLLEITAKHRTTLKGATLNFKSIAEAKYHNKHLTDFRIKGLAKGQQVLK